LTRSRSTVKASLAGFSGAGALLSPTEECIFSFALFSDLL
jgi:hypothetical protein